MLFTETLNCSSVGEIISFFCHVVSKLRGKSCDSVFFFQDGYTSFFFPCLESFLVEYFIGRSASYGNSNEVLSVRFRHHRRIIGKIFFLK